MSIKTILFKVCFICNWVFITDKRVSSLYFTLKSQEVWKVTSQQQIFALINIPWAITCKKGIGAQQGTPAERRGENWRKSNPSNSTDQSVGVENLKWILSEGQCSSMDHRTESSKLLKSSVEVCVALCTILLIVKYSLTMAHKLQETILWKVSRRSSPEWLHYAF